MLAQAGFQPGIFRSRGSILNHKATEAVFHREQTVVSLKARCVVSVEILVVLCSSGSDGSVWTMVSMEDETFTFLIHMSNI